jgi:dihydroxy-acid dehydratase
MSDADFKALEDAACPGAGACGGQFTANTMAIVCECLGIAALGSGSVPATDPGKPAVARRAGELAVRLAATGVRPRDNITRRAIQNAIAVVAATGGSTNAVLHLLAIAREAGVELSLDDFNRISAATPLIADLKPSGRFVATELHAAGGTPLVVRRLVESGAVDGTAKTVTGRSLGDEAREAVETPGQEVVRPNDRPLKPTGGLVILFGNLAPEGAVLKLSGTERALHRGPARVFDSEEQAFDTTPGHQGRRRRRHPIRRAVGRSRHA